MSSLIHLLEQSERDEQTHSRPTNKMTTTYSLANFVCWGVKDYVIPIAWLGKNPLTLKQGNSMPQNFQTSLQHSFYIFQSLKNHIYEKCNIVKHNNHKQGIIFSEVDLELENRMVIWVCGFFSTLYMYLPLHRTELQGISSCRLLPLFPQLLFSVDRLCLPK